MGVMNPTVGLTKNASETLKEMRGALGKNISVDLMLNAKNPKEGNLFVQFENVDAARKNMDRLREVMDKCGVKSERNLQIMTRDLG